MSKRHTDSTPDEKEPKRRKLSDSVLVEAARNGDTTAVRVGLEKLSPDTDSKTVAFDAVHEACRGNHDECLALLLPYVETTQMGFGMLLSECIHADHTACTEVLLQHWKSVCSNVAFVPHGQEADIQSKKPRPCPAMWADPAVFQVLIDAGADIETKDEKGFLPILLTSLSGKIAVVKMLVEAGAGVCVTDNERRTCLTLAACCGHTETVRYLVGLKVVDVNHTDSYGRTALHWAIQEGYRDVMQVLIDAGAGVCVTDNESYTCLTLASVYGHTEIVRYLVGLKEMDVHHADNNGCTALHWAVQEGPPDVVQVLIDAGADMEAKDNRGRSALLRASIAGKIAAVKMLVEAGAGVRFTDTKGATCFTLAANFGHTETVRYLVGLKDVDVNHSQNNGRTALHHVIHEGHRDVMQVLIDAGADIEAKDKKGFSPLLRASILGKFAIVKMLVEAGADVRVTNNRGDTCLILAAISGHTETVRYLAGLKDVDVNHALNNGHTALHWAVHEGPPDVVQVLIDAGADMEAKDDRGRSALLRASISGKIAAVKMLVEAGAGVRFTDTKGATCFTLAAFFGHTETVRYLVGLKDVDVSHSQNNGLTALHHVAHEGHRDVTQVLIDAGADIEAKDGLGFSPLLRASILGKFAIVKMLVEAGADVRVTDNEGNTCLILAENSGHIETVRYLAGLKDVDVNHAVNNGCTAVHYATSVDVLRVLATAGAVITARPNNPSSSALVTSEKGNNTAKVKTWIEAVAVATDSEGDTSPPFTSGSGQDSTSPHTCEMGRAERESASASAVGAGESTARLREGGEEDEDNEDTEEEDEAADEEDDTCEGYELVNVDRRGEGESDASPEGSGGSSGGGDEDSDGDSFVNISSIQSGLVVI